MKRGNVVTLAVALTLSSLTFATIHVIRGGGYKSTRAYRGLGNPAWPEPHLSWALPPWLRVADDFTLVPAETSVASSVFLATLLLGIGVMRWRGGDSSHAHQARSATKRP